MDNAPQETTKLTAKDIATLGGTVGMEIERSRAETAAPRLSGMLDELCRLPERRLAAADPAMRFGVERDE